MTELIPCKHLDYSDNYMDAADIETHHLYPHVKFWRRNVIFTDFQYNHCVQFCGKKKMRVNAIFDCYEKGFMHCYEPEESNND